MVVAFVLHDFDGRGDSGGGFYGHDGLEVQGADGGTLPFFVLGGGLGCRGEEVVVGHPGVVNELGKMSVSVGG